MKMVAVVFLGGTLFFGIGGLISAHDEGHGPMLTDQGRHGGVVSSVIDKKDIKKGIKAEGLYKAELVRSEDGIVRMYLFDNEMNVLDPVSFSKEARGMVETKKKGQYSRVPFALNFSGEAFTGSLPKPDRKPFNIDVSLRAGGRELFVGFENLD